MENLAENKEVFLKMGNDLLDKYTKALSKDPNRESKLAGLVGNNGFAINQTFKLGKNFSIEYVKNGDTEIPYVAVDVENSPQKLSVVSLMNVSSLNNYQTEGITVVNGQTYTANFDVNRWSEVTQPSTRVRSDYIRNCVAELSGKTVTYLGNIVRSITRRDGSSVFAVNTRLWNISD